MSADSGRTGGPRDLSGATAVVTGSTSGIGLATAEALAGAGARVVLAVRNTAKGEEVAAGVAGDTEVRRLELGDLASVTRFAADWRGPIDLLINNAGTYAKSRELTVDGFEAQFGVNYLGPFALTNLLLPQITGRVVSLTSQAERRGRIDFENLGWDRRDYKPSRAYAASKLAVLLFTGELQRRLTAAGSTVTANAAHPGFVATGMTGQGGGVGDALVRLLAQSPRDGALPVLLAATGDIPGDSFTGPEHLLHMRGGAELIGRSRRARDTTLATRLWRVSEELTDVSFPL